MQPQFVDLHTHTSASDGTDSPRELVLKAAKLGLAAIAITDHDTLSGLAEAQAAGIEAGIEVIRGCELGVMSPYGEVHLVGLWLPEDCSPLEVALEGLRRARERRNRRILQKLEVLGISIPYEAVLEQAQGESVGRPHIAAAMCAMGVVGSRRGAFRDFLGSYGSAYVPRELPTPEEGVRLLSGLGAMVSFAHPMLLRCPRDWFDSILPQLKQAGLGAIEAYHTEHSAQDERFCAELASRYDLGVSGGSDYHGASRPEVRLGRGRGGLRVTVGILDVLKSRMRRLAG